MWCHVFSHAAMSSGVVALELEVRGKVTLRKHAARPGKTWLLGACKCSWDMRLPYRLSLGREVREGKGRKDDRKMTDLTLLTQAKPHKTNIFSPDRRSFGKICRQGNDEDHFERVSYSYLQFMVWLCLIVCLIWHLFVFVIHFDSIDSLYFIMLLLAFFHSLWVSRLSWFSPPGCWKQWIRSDWSEKINLGASRVQRAVQNIMQSWTRQIRSYKTLCSTSFMQFGQGISMNFPISQFSERIELFLRSKPSQDLNYDFRWLQDDFSTLWCQGTVAALLWSWPGSWY